MKKRVKIISEIAQGFEGNFKTADLLLDSCINSRADIIKFQLIYADELSTKTYKHYKLFKKLEMSLLKWKYLVKKTKKNNLQFYFDIFGDKSFRIANKLKVDGVKITSTDFYNENLIQKSLKSFKKVILSVSGVSKLELYNRLKNLNFNKKLILMYGFQSEPTKVKDNNLNRILELKKLFPKNSIGFMDHTHGKSELANLVPILSLGLGIDYLEKHITLDHSLKLEDHISALDPENFRKFVKLFRKMEPALGQKGYKVGKMEMQYKKIASKSVLLKKDLNKGAKIKLKDVFLKRIKNNNKSLKNPNLIIGKIAKKKLKINQILKQSYFK